MWTKSEASLAGGVTMTLAQDTKNEAKAGSGGEGSDCDPEERRGSGHLSTSRWGNTKWRRSKTLLHKTRNAWKNSKNVHEYTHMARCLHCRKYFTRGRCASKLRRGNSANTSSRGKHKTKDEFRKRCLNKFQKYRNKSHQWRGASSPRAS